MNPHDQSKATSAAPQHSQFNKSFLRQPCGGVSAPISREYPLEIWCLSRMSDLLPISSALPPTTDVIEACSRLPKLTQLGHAYKNDMDT